MRSGREWHGTAESLPSEFIVQRLFRSFYHLYQQEEWQGSLQMCCSAVCLTRSKQTTFCFRNLILHGAAPYQCCHSGNLVLPPTMLTVISKTVYFSYVHTCVSVYGFAHVNSESRRLDPWSWSYRWWCVSCLMWVLGTELGSSVRVALQLLSHWAISLAVCW